MSCKFKTSWTFVSKSDLMNLNNHPHAVNTHNKQFKLESLNHFKIKENVTQPEIGRL